MLLDELQQTWQSQLEARLRIEPAILLQELRRNQRSFKAMIFWRDVREVVVAAVTAVFFAYWGFAGHDWSWLLLAGACLWVGGYILVDRFRRRGRRARFDDSLLGCVASSLEDVEHQIWLLKNVLWWYLLPLGGGMAIGLVSMGLVPDDFPWIRWVAVSIVAAICAATFWVVYRLNQKAVERELEPRRQELLAARESLLEEGS